ncbi:hypothetical protein CQW23_24428 [Capsicum baccatum]|uniref:RNase H type-1 domain-containing protein n=1 Tax=Capsicum baccatum TaxID=33114 RepID=A0A2G2VUR4_CAPBA|nr:hypothetical protein CQW23_24428 [Capsicum baccatum]
MTSWFIIQQVIKFIKLIINLQFPDLQLSTSWHEMYTTVEQLNLVIHSQAIFWHKPDHGWVKLNVDGCSKGNPGPAVGGGIIRDHAGVMISTFVEFYGECSNNLAEAKAMFTGISICLNKGPRNVIVESDSMIIINLIKRVKKTSMAAY